MGMHIDESRKDQILIRQLHDTVLFIFQLQNHLSVVSECRFSPDITALNSPMSHK